MIAGFMAAAVVSVAAVHAQFPRPLSPQPEQGNRVTPFFDGWYSNPDGTISFSFGYSNLNKDTVEIPLGPDNFITPKEYDGRQPTSFPAVEPDPDNGNPNAGIAIAGAAGGGAAGAGTSPGAGGGTAPAAGGAAPAAGAAAPAAGRGGASNISRHDRERGVFTVTVPGSYQGDVVWTLRYQGQTWSVPGRSKAGQYQLSWPMAMGSTPPLVRFQPAGPSGRGPTGIQAPPARAKVGEPLELSAWLTDDAVHEKEPITIKREVKPSMNVTWYKHAGPAAPVDFSPKKAPVTDPQGKATASVTFKEPGDYVVRLRADTFGNIDSAAADQCCWTNGYWKVAVTR